MTEAEDTHTIRMLDCMTILDCCAVYVNADYFPVLHARKGNPVELSSQFLNLCMVQPWIQVWCIKSDSFSD